MRKLLSFLLGIGLGAVAGVLLVTLFSPVSGREVRENLKDHYQNALDEARKASAAKRAELETELERMKDNA
jgi:gas vesicle protein